MINSDTLFYLFSTILVVSACLVVFMWHPVFSLLFLIVSFVFAAFLLVLLECEFLALLFIIIYVGAIIILFLFSIMMLETKLNNLIKNAIFYTPVGFFFSLFLAIPFFSQISKCFWNQDIYIPNFNIYQNWYNLIDCINDISVYGQVLYSYYIFQFLISGIILLLVLIGVVSITNVFVIQWSLNQSLFKQLSRNFRYVLKK